MEDGGFLAKAEEPSNGWRKDNLGILLDHALPIYLVGTTHNLTTRSLTFINNLVSRKLIIHTQFVNLSIQQSTGAAVLLAAQFWIKHYAYYYYLMCLATSMHNS